MSTDEYVPDEMDARGCFLDGAAGAFTAEDWEAFLARVRRDAAREALDGLIEHADLLAKQAGTYAARSIWQTVAGFAEGNRDTHYPEETP